MESQERIPNDYEDPTKSEKIDGVIYAMAAGTSKYADIVSNLHIILGAFLKGKTCHPYTSELEIFLDEDNIFRPDISVICDFSKMGEDGYEGVPALVIEVLSPSTAKKDYGKKLRAYEKYGVQEYWIINPEHQVVEQFILTDGVFKPIIAHLTEFSSFIFPDLVINLADIFVFRRLLLQ